MTDRRADARPALLALLACLAAFALVVRGNPAGGIAAVLIDGWPAALNLIAATLAGLAVARRIVPDAPRSLLLATGGGLGVGLLATLVFLLGTFGLLNAATAYALPLAMLVVGGLDLRLDRDRWRTPIVVPWTTALPAVGIGLAMGAATLPAGAMWGGEPNAYDVLSYHLQLPREWYELGRVATLDHSVFSRFPLANEMLFLLPMHQLGGPWQAQYAAHGTNVGLLALAALAAYGVGGVLAATLVATLPWSIMLGSIAYNEPLLILAATLTAAWAGRAGWRAATVAGLAAGLGGAAKYTGLPVLVGGGVLAVLAACLLEHLASSSAVAAGPVPCIVDPPMPDARGRPRGYDRSRDGQVMAQGALTKRLAASAGGFLAAASVFPVPWLVRNLIEFGNPVSPLVGDVAGWTAQQVERWHAAHSLPASQSAVGQALKEVVLSPNYGYVLWPLALIGFVIGLRRSREAAAAAAVLLATTLIVWLASTHLIGRFLVAAVGPAAVLAGLLPNAATRWIAPAVAALGVGLTLLLAGGNADARGLLTLTAGDRAALIGTSGPPTYFTPFDDFDRIAGRDLYLVGDAEAWAYPHPVERLHYKVVFDVPPADGALRAWLGDAVEAADDDALVVVDLASIDRLARTYGTPRLEVDVPPDPRSPLPGKPVLTMRQVRALLGVSPPASQATPLTR